MISNLAYKGQLKILMDNYKNDFQSPSSNDFQIKDDSLSNNLNDNPLDVQILTHEIRDLSEKSTATFMNNDFKALKNALLNLSTLMNEKIDGILYKQIESTVLTVFKNLNFDIFIYKLCDTIASNDQFNEIINYAIDIIHFLTVLDSSYLTNYNFIPFLNSIYFNHENIMKIQTKIIEIYSRILPNQIIYDPNFQNFAPTFFKILETLQNYDLKANLVESFICSSCEMKIYFQSLLPFLSFFLQKERCSEIEIRIITSLLQQEKKIFPFLCQNGFIQHILNSVSNCIEDINIRIINFYLFIFNFDVEIRKSFNFDNVCLNLLDSESEEEQSFALNYFWHFIPECLPLLFDENKIGIDLLWSIISDSFFCDSKIEIKTMSMRFLLKLLQFNNNNDMMTCILNSNVCEICETMLNLGDFESVCLSIDVLNFLLNITVRDPSYAVVFIPQFKRSENESILSSLSDDDLQRKAVDFLSKFDQLCQNS